MAKHLPHILDLCIVEMVVRAAKHVLKVSLVAVDRNLQILVYNFIYTMLLGYLWSSSSHPDSIYACVCTPALYLVTRFISMAYGNYECRYFQLWLLGSKI